jgi:hypothetical protein
MFRLSRSLLLGLASLLGLVRDRLGYILWFHMRRGAAAGQLPMPQVLKSLLSSLAPDLGLRTRALRLLRPSLV